MIDRIRAWRNEQRKDELDTLRARLARAKRFDYSFGGRRGQIRSLERKIERLEEKVDA